MEHRGEGWAERAVGYVTCPEATPPPPPTTWSHPLPRSPLCVCVRCRSQVSNPRPPSTGCCHWIIQERLNALCSELTETKPHLGRISHHKLRSKSPLVAWKCCYMLGIMEKLIMMVGIIYWCWNTDLNKASLGPTSHHRDTLKGLLRFIKWLQCRFYTEVKQ